MNEPQNLDFMFSKEIKVEYRGKESHRRVTIGAILEGKTLRFGTAQCLPQDQYVKTKARVITSGRATKKPCLVVDTTADKYAGKSASKIFNIVCHELCADKSFWSNKGSTVATV
jgi:hypothetical protein